MNDHGHILEPGMVRIERVLPGPIERVWDYLTRAEQRRRWLAGGEFELRPGGRASLKFAHRDISPETEAPPRYREAADSGFAAEVIACEPPRLLAITWGGAEDPSEVAFELRAEADKVRLVVTHRRLARREALVDVAAGWHTHLGILEDDLEQRPHRGFWSSHAALAADYGRRAAEMDDYFAWSRDTGRELRGAGELWSSLLRRRLPAAVERVWAAWTDPTVVPRWFARPEGTFAVGGTIALDLSAPEKATLEILACEPPRRLRTTWTYGGLPTTEVELRLAPDGDGTILELEHLLATSPDGARGTGSGWEVGLLHLDRFLRDLPAPSGVMHPAMDHAWTRVRA
jgi:uncharacterized protein YndB with AHSA1/START domain